MNRRNGSASRSTNSISAEAGPSPRTLPENASFSRSWPPGPDTDTPLTRAGGAALLARANPETGPAPLQGLALPPSILRCFRQEGRNQGGSPGGVERHHRDIGAAAVRLQPRQRILGNDLHADLHRGAKGGIDRGEQFEDVAELHRDAEHQRVD